ncbi:hypothetical protein D3C80_1103700 [compost metagenome]
MSDFLSDIESVNAKGAIKAADTAIERKTSANAVDSCLCRLTRMIESAAQNAAAAAAAYARNPSFPLGGRIRSAPVNPKMIASNCTYEGLSDRNIQLPNATMMGVRLRTE